VAVLMAFFVQKGRPPQLLLSPSDPALAAPVMEEDRGVLSDVGNTVLRCLQRLTSIL
jgi:hypothetical protein